LSRYSIVNIKTAAVKISTTRPTEEHWEGFVGKVAKLLKFKVQNNCFISGNVHRCTCQPASTNL